MNNPDQLKETVKEKYTAIVESSASGCGCGCGSTNVIMKDEYTNLEGYVPEADLGLGCGLPTEIAAIKPGDTVLDLGSGAGNDAFVARRIVGSLGRVLGVDMTEAMVRKARENALKLGYENVEFRLGDIESLPVDSNSVDVAVSNCVLNLVPDKAKAFSEIHRVLKVGGHFSISDIVTSGDLPGAIRSAAELYVGCIGGAMEKESYLTVVKDAGFRHIAVKKEKSIPLPDETLEGNLTQDEIREFRTSGVEILSITVYAEKG